MGYNTDFDGVLTIVEPAALTVDHLRYLNFLFDQEPTRNDRPRDENPPEYVALQLNKEMTGLEWSGAEKTYNMVETLNWLIECMRAKFGSFRLEGVMSADGESRGDEWRIVFDAEGNARKQAIDHYADIRSADEVEVWRAIWVILDGREKSVVDVNRYAKTADYHEVVSDAFKQVRKILKEKGYGPTG